ncbi:LysM peptidoglycan-binding domain-containing protein [Rhizobium grahamii]|uniref:LysM peptidoglycan-binding domain-containing protein n=1 Tax=Rhizobium grahamii TaxID=1120045 RepID=A0A5Q0C7K2_9HYPH|nr:MULTISPECIES: LysM peptidoglycan-binding domain-containing protein [Rhizobium]QFY59599.1 LysM peptidoglycan-binding domain-containing protein [Rhizobium grahamii]QRM47876.1 LysM peptidoglycan-binding domain-containing protein [Rhizobium sp. BG6]
MMRNRAGLLALAVLVIAILLMVFVVMPRIGGDAAKVGDAINQATSEVKNTVADAAKTSRPAADDAATTKALSGLTSGAAQALTELKALFADGKGPTQEVFASAKAKAVTTLQTLADFGIPEGTNPVTSAAVQKAKDGAGKALAIIQALPENIPDALAAIAKAEAALTGAPEPAAQANGQAAAPATPAAPDATANAGPKAPTFDVLRVEPDGSTVIAGSAEPNSKLEVLDGDKVVTTTDVGPSGDFAAVLDNPLSAGDHQLLLKATGKDGKSTVSEEVATVSVPKDGNGADLLAMVSKPGTASRIITAPTASAAAGAATPPASGNAAANDNGQTQQASASPATQPATTPDAGKPAASGPAADVMVNAVEIEGDKIFVAGTAKPSSTVVAYADDKLIGKSLAGQDGHFVIDGVMPLAVGDHKIRVDVLDASGKVAVRASVNFNRPAGNQVTVAAQSGGSASSAPTMVPLDEGALGKLRNDVAKAFGLLSNLFADGKLPGAEQLAAARSANEIALRSIIDFRAAADATADFKERATNASVDAAGALKFLQSLPIDAKSVGASLSKLGEMVAKLSPPAETPAAPAATNEVASSENQPATIEQAPLQQSKDTVIIRRGDTLWQISRRVYGLGVRYTTIYVANEDKINNPDRILPGQIFGLPKDVLPNAEELHRKRLSGEHL